MNKVKNIVGILLFGLILLLLLIIKFKNNKIDRLYLELQECEDRIEYIGITKVDTITDSIPYPVEVIKYKIKEREVPIKAPVPTKLTKEDSINILDYYLDVYNDYTTLNKYSDVLKDDSLAFIKIEEDVQYNRIFDRRLTYKHRTPIVKYTTKVPDNTTSIIGGIGGNFNNIYITSGLVTKNNRVYIVGYDPFKKDITVNVNIPLFSIKR